MLLTVCCTHKTKCSNNYDCPPGLREQRVKEFEVSPDGESLLLTGTSGYLHVLTMKVGDCRWQIPGIPHIQNGSKCKTPFWIRRIHVLHKCLCFLTVVFILIFSDKGGSEKHEDQRKHCGSGFFPRRQQSLHQFWWVFTLV
jgi:hypothetical protein